MDAEIGSRNHRQIIWIRRMKQGMEVSKARALRRQISQILVLARDLVVHIFENDDQHAVEVVSGARAAARAASSCFPWGDFVTWG